MPATYDAGHHNFELRGGKIGAGCAAWLRASGGRGKVAVVLWLDEGARGGGGHRQEEVRRLRGQGAKFWAADRGGGAVGRWLRERRARGR